MKHIAKQNRYSAWAALTLASGILLSFVPQASALTPIEPCLDCTEPDPDVGTAPTPSSQGPVNIGGDGVINEDYDIDGDGIYQGQYNGGDGDGILNGDRDVDADAPYRGHYNDGDEYGRIYQSTVTGYPNTSNGQHYNPFGNPSYPRTWNRDLQDGQAESQGRADTTKDQGKDTGGKTPNSGESAGNIAGPKH